MHYIEKPDGKIREIVGTAFPDYKGRKFSISTVVPNRIDSFWDGGSRTYYVFYELATGKAFNVHSNHPMFERGNPNYIEKLPRGILLIAHKIFCGKDMGITIYANSEDLAPMLPAPMEIDDQMKVVLKYTKTFKNTYGGRKHIRFHEAHCETGISRVGWLEAKERCIAKGLLAKNGSITPSGRNAIA